MYYSYIEIEDIATSFSPARTDLTLKLSTQSIRVFLMHSTKLHEGTGGSENTRPVKDGGSGHGADTGLQDEAREDECR
jgi:hypothetical protein